MRVWKISLVAALAACGSKSTVQATPQIKQSATQATQALSKTSTGTQASIGLASLGNSLAAAGSAGNAGGINISGLPAPAVLAASGVRPPSGGPAGALRPPVNGQGAVTSPNGCIQASNGQAVWVSAGSGTCSATDHLEIDYANGDKVDITWAGTATSFTLTFQVVAGSWSGTNLTFAATSSGSGTSGAAGSVHVTGTMLYAGTSGGADSVNVDFDVTYQLQSASAGAVNLTVNGTATDHIDGVKVLENWTLAISSTGTSGSSGSTTIDWKGSAEIDLLNASGAVQDSVKLENVDIHLALQSTSSSVSVTYTVSGDVLWDGAVVGSLVAANNAVQVKWTDGTSTPFDVGSLLGHSLG